MKDKISECISSYIAERESFYETEASMILNLSKYLKTIGIDDIFPAVSVHKCNKSPIGWCIYDEIEDPVHDYCLFCHEPEERK